jgi:hypothetical protein
VSLTADVPFDADTVIYCAEGWGNRHGRFYSPSTFKRKIVDRFRDVLAFHFFTSSTPTRCIPVRALRVSGDAALIYGHHKQRPAGPAQTVMLIKLRTPTSDRSAVAHRR